MHCLVCALSFRHIGDWRSGAGNPLTPVLSNPRTDTISGIPHYPQTLHPPHPNKIIMYLGPRGEALFVAAVKADVDTEYVGHPKVKDRARVFDRHLARVVQLHQALDHQVQLDVARPGVHDHVPGRVAPPAPKLEALVHLHPEHAAPPVEEAPAFRRGGSIFFSEMLERKLSS